MMNGTAELIHQNAMYHGWWDEKRTLPELLMLMVSEASEALEEDRMGNEPFYFISDKTGGIVTDLALISEEKPEGWAVEIIDMIIRALDTLAHHDIDIDALLWAKHRYNKRRPHMHGGKRY